MSGERRRFDLERINAMLLDRLDALLAELPLPDPMPGHRPGREYRFRHKGSLVVYGPGHRKAGP